MQGLCKAAKGSARQRARGSAFSRRVNPHLLLLPPLPLFLLFSPPDLEWRRGASSLTIEHKQTSHLCLSTHLSQTYSKYPFPSTPSRFRRATCTSVWMPGFEAWQWRFTSHINTNATTTPRLEPIEMRFQPPLRELPPHLPGKDISPFSSLPSLLTLCLSVPRRSHAPLVPRSRFPPRSRIKQQQHYTYA